MKTYPFLLSILLSNIISVSYSQTQLQFNILGDVGFSMAGSKSHYYYNGIDQDHTDARVKPMQLNLIAKLSFSNNWSFNSRVLLEGDKDVRFDKFSVPQLNLQWLSGKRKFGFTAGTFTNPFGSLTRSLKTQATLNHY